MIGAGPDGLDTPYLLVHREVLERNLLAMQGYAETAGIGLRPHAKTHKLVEVAQRQIDLGAIGLTVATLSEAEAFTAAGVRDLFIAYPVGLHRHAAEGLFRLARQARISVAVDSVEALRTLRHFGAPTDGSLALRVEVDCGLRRTGCTPAAAAQLAQDAAAAGIPVEGVFTYPGHAYAIGGAAQAAADEAAALAAAVAAFDNLGLACPVRSGGSTPSARQSHSDIVTEIRPGVYAFNDAQQLALGSATIDDVALSVITTVISMPSVERFVLDAGSKTIASDRPTYTDSFGILPSIPGSRIERLWEHHAVVDASKVRQADLPRIGQRLELIPNHVCTAVNLAARVIVAHEQGWQSWPVRAREPK